METEKLFTKLKKIRNSLERKLFFTAILTESLKEENLKPIIVGGTAVEFYTLGGCSTLDIDLVCEIESVNKKLIEFGFKEYGRHWYNEELDLAIEIPSSTLTGNGSKLTKIEIGGLKAYMIGIEDIVAEG